MDKNRPPELEMTLNGEFVSPSVAPVSTRILFWAIVVAAVAGAASLAALALTLALTILPFWKIFSKAGYSGAWSLLMLVPLVNVLAIWIFAFSDWPVRRGQR